VKGARISFAAAKRLAPPEATVIARPLKFQSDETVERIQDTEDAAGILFPF
jgi:hypothetical protein